MEVVYRHGLEDDTTFDRQSGHRRTHGWSSRNRTSLLTTRLPSNSVEEYQSSHNGDLVTSKPYPRQ
jgi:hypothetical protein